MGANWRVTHYAKAERATRVDPGAPAEIEVEAIGISDIETLAQELAYANPEIRDASESVFDRTWRKLSTAKVDTLLRMAEQTLWQQAEACGMAEVEAGDN